jgi:hypothetical protein
MPSRLVALWGSAYEEVNALSSSVMKRDEDISSEY